MATILKVSNCGRLSPWGGFIWFSGCDKTGFRRSRLCLMCGTRDTWRPAYQNTELHRLFMLGPLGILIVKYGR